MWEYQITFFNPTTNIGGIMFHMNEMGSRNWELVNSESGVLFWKRRIDNANPAQA